MTDTREKILLTALELFAQNGYEAVSVSDIAGSLGITKGALYRHYENKRDIFDSIVARMFELDEARARESKMPEAAFDRSPEAYRCTAIESIKRFTLAQFEFWTRDSFAAPFRRMLTLEQYRSREMAKLYADCLAAGPVAYMEDIFRETGLFDASCARQRAAEYYGPMFLLMSMADYSGGEGEMRLLQAHIDRFFEEKSNEIR